MHYLFLHRVVIGKASAMMYQAQKPSVLREIHPVGTECSTCWHQLLSETVRKTAMAHMEGTMRILSVLSSRFFDAKER